MALQGDLIDSTWIPQIDIAPIDLPDLLHPVEESPLEFRIQGYSGYILNFTPGVTTIAIVYSLYD